MVMLPSGSYRDDSMLTPAANNALALTVPVPANVEMEGYGIPIYVNIRYPWTWHGVRPTPPVVPPDDPKSPLKR